MVQGSGLTVLSGGRYDNLLGEFGTDKPAIGFAVDVSAVTDVLHEEINLDRPLRIALTKGRLEKASVQMFKTMGLNTEALENKGRRLILPVDQYEAVLSKAPDVITYVEHGVCDIGIVGKDTIVEHGSAFYEVLDLNIGRCAFALATKKGTDFFSGYKRKTVASKYPKVAKEFFKSKGMDVDVIKIEGSVELAPLLGLADGIVDIVETGSTLKENGLEVVEKIMPISARVIVNMASMKLRKDEIEAFLHDIELAAQVVERGRTMKITKANGVIEYQLLAQLKQRAGETDPKITEAVTTIINGVKEGGDEAVREYTVRFDGSVPKKIEFDKDEIYAFLDQVDPAFKDAVVKAQQNIYDFHQRQAQQSWMTTKESGVIMGQRIRGLKRVGIYVPGGTAAYPSSVLMNAVPAKIAGVQEIIMVTPPGKDGNPNPNIMAAAAVAGVDKVFLVGGAQAVAALAYGTQRIPKVDKIVGPGNIFVATAKKLLYGVVDIDMVAGPSEILIVADSTADASFLAADLMSQAEHDVRASAILLTTSESLAKSTLRRLTGRSRPWCGRRSFKNPLTTTVKSLCATICARRWILRTNWRRSTWNCAWLSR